MLTKLTMENIASFKNETVIDFRSTNYKILEKTNVYDGILKGALFVGANASGKTNIIHVIRFLLELLFGEKIINLYESRCLFSQKPTYKMIYEFEIEKNTICYLIEYDGEHERFASETLSVNGQEVLNRTGGEGQSSITDFARSFANIDPDTLLLREIYFNTKFRTQPVLKKWFDFLLNSVFLDGYSKDIFAPGNIPLSLRKFLKTPGGVESINQFFEKFHFNQRIEYGNSSHSDYEKDLFFKREGVGVPIPYANESLGNQNLLHLLPPFFHVIHHGGMLIVDEFSSGLHNFLEELLIRYFMKHAKNSQIFLVTHSTNLLSNALVRPDQIYAVNFKGMEGSRVKRFSSEKPREAQNIEKMYTSGVFGGVPTYSDDDDYAE